MGIERDAKRPRFHHPAEGIIAQRGMIEMERQRGRGLTRPAISHPNAKDGAGFNRQPCPNPGGFQQALGGQRNGIGAAIKGRHFHGRQGRGINNCGPDARAGETRSQSGANRPGAHHTNINILKGFHGPSLSGRACRTKP